MTENPNGSDPDRARALADLAEMFPAWYLWPGTIPPLLYARRPRTSPPMVVRSTTAEGLRREIERAEAERGFA